MSFKNLKKLTKLCTKFNNFNQLKQFPNIFNTDFSNPPNYFTNMANVLRFPFKRKVINDIPPDEQWLYIYKDPKFVPYLNMYKQLQQYNGISCCGVIALSPLLFSPTEIQTILNDVFLYHPRDETSLTKFVLIAYNRIKNLLNPTTLKLLKHIVGFEYVENTGNYELTGTNTLIQVEVLKDLGLRLCEIVVERDGTVKYQLYEGEPDSPIYFILKYKTELQSNHVEVCVHPTDFTKVDDYYDMRTIEYLHYTLGKPYQKQKWELNNYEEQDNRSDIEIIIDGILGENGANYETTEEESQFEPVNVMLRRKRTRLWRDLRYLKKTRNNQEERQELEQQIADLNIQIYKQEEATNELNIDVYLLQQQKKKLQQELERVIDAKEWQPGVMSHLIHQISQLDKKIYAYKMYGDEYFTMNKVNRRGRRVRRNNRVNNRRGRRQRMGVNRPRITNIKRQVVVNKNKKNTWPLVKYGRGRQIYKKADGITYLETPYPNLNPRITFNRYRQALSDYFKTLLFPELAVNGTFIAKQPSYIPIPTSNVTFKENITINVPTSSGEFACIWVPNYLATQNIIDEIQPTSDIYVSNYYSHFYYKLGNLWYLHTSIVPKIDITKYRLVSAKMSIQYNGSVLNKGGQFLTCAVYTDLPTIMARDTAIKEDHLVLENQLTYYPLFNSLIDSENVSNGLWNKYVNITLSKGRIDNLALPTDPTDHTFFPLGNYYSSNPVTVSETVMATQSLDGGHLSYVGLGKGLIASGYNALPVSVIIYYNFEVLAAQTTAPFLRGKSRRGKFGAFLNKNKESILNSVSDIASSVDELSLENPKVGKLVTSAVESLIMSGPESGEL